MLLNHEGRESPFHWPSPSRTSWASDYKVQIQIKLLRAPGEEVNLSVLRRYGKTLSAFVGAFLVVALLLAPISAGDDGELIEADGSLDAYNPDIDFDVGASSAFILDGNWEARIDVDSAVEFRASYLELNVLEELPGTVDRFALTLTDLTEVSIGASHLAIAGTLVFDKAGTDTTTGEPFLTTFGFAARILIDSSEILIFLGPFEPDFVIRGSVDELEFDEDELDEIDLEDLEEFDEDDLVEFGDGTVAIWHRLNPDPSNPTPEHEVLGCRLLGGSWACKYDKIPEPTLGFEQPPEGTFGFFGGVELPLSGPGAFVCVDGFPFDCPDDVSLVIGGTMTFQPPGGPGFTVSQQLIVTEDEILFVYWQSPHNFVCPWHQTFEDALDANPFPLPFNGIDGPANDCVFGVG